MGLKDYTDESISKFFNPCNPLEQFKFLCSRSAVAEDEPGKEAEAGDALASPMQADAAWRRHRQAERYRKS